MYKRIRDLREDNDLTQTHIAKYLNCSQRVYSNYERGEVIVPIDIFIKLAAFYNTSIDYLAGLTDDMRPYKRR